MKLHGLGQDLQDLHEARQLPSHAVEAVESLARQDTLADDRGDPAAGGDLVHVSTGQLEQDADGILFLFREAAYNPATETPELLEVGIAKQRNGRAPRTAFCHYQPGDGYVRNLSHGDQMRVQAQKSKL